MLARSCAYRTFLGLAIALAAGTTAWATDPNFQVLQTFTNGSPMDLNMVYSIYVNDTWAFNVDYNGGWAYSLRRNTTNGTLTYLNSVRLSTDAGSTTGEIMATTYMGPQDIVYFCCFMSHSGDNSGSKGIVYYRVDATTGAFTLLGVVPCSLGYIADSGDPYRPWLFSAYDNTVYEVVIDSVTGVPSIGTRKCVGTGMSPVFANGWAVTADHKFLYCMTGSKIGYAGINGDGSLTYKGSYDLTPLGLLDNRCVGVSYDGRYLYVMPGILSFPTTYGLVGIFQRNLATGALTWQENQIIPSNQLIGQLIFHRSNTIVFYQTIYYIGSRISWTTRDPATGRFGMLAAGVSCSPDTGNNIVFTGDTGTLYGTAWYTQVLLVINTNVPVGPDTPPAAVTDLRVGALTPVGVTLNWTATGDDGTTGQAAAYDLRYSTSPITDANWAAATQVSGLPFPQPSGGTETFTVAPLQGSTTYYFAIKVQDPAGHISALSNMLSATTLPPDTVAPNWIGNLVGKPSPSGGVDLAWTAPADYGYNGGGPYTCGSYDIRYSTSPITAANFAAATRVTGVPAPKAPGSAEAFTATGLSAGTQYYFCMKAANVSGNVSEVSNCAPATSSVLGTKTLQVGLNGYAGAKDSYIYGGSPTTNYGALDRMTVAGFYDTGGSLSLQRGLVKFNVSSIPAVTQLTGATLCLYSYDTAYVKGSTGFYGVYPLTRDWTDAQTTWNIAKTGTNWTTAGGDVAATPDATSPKQATAGVWYPFDVMARVQAWLAVPSTNYGWLVKCTDENLHNQDRFYTSDTTNATLRPKLVVSDMVPAVPGDINGDGGVDVIDLLIFVDSFGATCGVDRAYDPLCDFNGDGSVDVIDLLTLVDYWPQ